MVNAVMDAIALLSSLATDLDIMLNDLRSSPSTRLLPPTHQAHHAQPQQQQQHHQQHRNANSTSSPLTVGGADASGYLERAIRSSYSQQQFATTTTTATTTTATSSTHFNRQQYLRTSATARNHHQPPQQRLNQDSCKLHDSATAHDVVGNSGNPATGSEPQAHVGLSPDVRQIQKLPLWSYQQRQLQQPQKLHVQLLQQHQQATKAIATKITADTCASNSAAFKTDEASQTASYFTAGASNGNSNHNGRSSCWLQGTTCLLSNSRDRASQWSSNDSQPTTTLLSSSTTSTTSSQLQQQTIQTQQNQLKSSTTATTPSTGSVAAGNVNINNNNNNSRRLPFCGLDSIKGSDNNGGLQQQQQLNGGNTNLSFDLSAVVGVGGGIGGHTQLDTQSEQFHSLDANESSCCGDGAFEDDMQALLPKCRLSRDELSPSRTSLVSSSDGGILAEGETSSETSQCSDECPPCDLGLVERLMLTHPVWFLPGIQRSGAVHFLQGKEEGNFIVRGSSQHNTMAVSVRLPPDTGPYIEHYLIQSNEGIISLESSRFKFNSIPALIAHYAQCCDELPVQLVLPRALREAKNRQQLSSLALLGQEFWRYPMSCPKQEETEANFLDAKSPNSLTETSGIGTTVFSNSTSSNGPMPQQAQKQMAPKLFSPTNNLTGMFSQAGTPSDTTSSMSSFSTSGGQQLQMMSPESVDSVILTMSPVDHINNQRNALNGMQPSTELGNVPSLLSTFKSNANTQIMPFKPNKPGNDNCIRPQRPTPPNTLNLDLRKPPAPPLRWSKPLTPNSPLLTPDGTHPLNGNNFTVTTTVTFSVDNKNSPQFVEVTTPATNAMNSAMNTNAATFQTFSKRLSPEGECKDTLSSQGSSGSRWHSQSSKDSTNSQRLILSPGSTGTPTGISNHKSRKSKARKESKHYQESDILESPQIYCRSNLADKFSDYEDLWTHDPSDRAGLLTSFKPNLDGVQGKRPDLLAETPSITSLNCNVLSPANSTMSSVSPPNASDVTATPTAELTADSPQLIQLTAEQSQPRSRAALLLPALMSQSLNEDQLKSTSEGDTTPTAQTPNSRSKQGSPFYAEPADALRQAGLTASILRRSHRGALLPSNHRHSEPPKGGITRTPMCALMVPGDIEKIAGSLDELKKKPTQPQQMQPTQQQPSKRARGRFEQWQLDSSWEFMGKQGEEDDDEDGDYDSAEHWKPPAQTSQEKQNSLGRECNKEIKEKPITVHQIIAKRLPDLNLPELVRCSTPQQQQTHQNGSQKSIDSQTGCRLSSYDNVERNLSFFTGIDSSQSDDGTVFSEPWDPSQWDSFMPQDDTTITSDSIHLSKCRPVVSEDDTIIEELSTKENNQDTLKARKSHGRQKVATILRNPSIRDREILCHPRNKINPYGIGSGPGDTVRAYTLQLALDQSSTFSRNIENFISCTKESREAAPQVVMRNMRQFMNGMKNYLVKHGEGKFQQEVESARSRLKSDEFLNLDAILETVMHQLVVLPLREHLYGMFVDYYTRSEDIQLLAQNVKYACGRSAADFGIRASVTPPTPSSLHVISNLLLRLQEAELPLEKLDLFLCVISTIFDATGCPRGQQLGADDFLPILVYVVAKCGFVGAEIEAEFMWGLLQPTLLNGEPGYYLTALCSAVHVLKSFMASENESGTGSLDWRASSLPACSSVLRVIIPDECNGSLQTRTLPVRPHTTTREVCRIIAHKARITNPQDYALFKLVDGEETPLSETECPQDIRLAAKGKHCMLAYKRIDAKIAWPTAAQPVYN